MRKFIFTLAFFSVIQLFAQEKYRVVLDYQTGDLSYYKIDKKNQISDTLSKPKFKKESLVQIQVKNINPFAVNLNAEVKEEFIHRSGQGFNIGGLIGGIGSLTGEDLKMNAPNIQSNTDQFGEMFKSRGEKVSKNFDELNEISANVAAMKTTLMANLSNPNLSKEQIQKNLLELSKMYENAALTTNPEDNFYKHLIDLEKIVQTEKIAIENDLKVMEESIQANTDPATRGGLNQSQGAFQNIQNVQRNLSQSTSQNIDNINQIKSLFSRLEASNFEQSFDYQITTDNAQLELVFSPSEFATAGGTQASGSVIRQVKMKSSGGFKVNTSVALTLNSFGDKSKSYFIDQEGVIGQDVENYFVPNIATMINFYPLISESVNFGGSFGVSIPLSADLKGINFLLGPTLVFGSKSRVSFSGGLAYGPVNKLTNGLEVGQISEFSSLENFTKTVYELGYFFGISFSLFDL